jgi:hypothetical protein
MASPALLQKVKDLFSSSLELTSEQRLKIGIKTDVQGPRTKPRIKVGTVLAIKNASTWPLIPYLAAINAFTTKPATTLKKEKNEMIDDPINKRSSGG